MGSEMCIRDRERRPEQGEKTLQEGALKVLTLWSPRTREEAPASDTKEDTTGRAEEAEEDRGREAPEVPASAAAGEGSSTGAGWSGENTSSGAAEEARGSAAGAGGSGAEERTEARETVDELRGGDVEEAGSGSNSWCS